MKPNHHLDHSTIVSLAAGTLGGTFVVVAAAHLSLCPACRAALREAEALGGEMLDGLPAGVVSDECRDRTWRALDQAAPDHRPAAVPQPDVRQSLAWLLDISSIDDIAWKKKAPGVAMCDVRLPFHAKGQLKLLRIGAGRAIPEHGHGGEEITLVLKGAYRDHLGEFVRGDVADLDEDVEHQPVVGPAEDCICLVATEKPTRFKSLVARLMQPFVGI